MRSSRTVAVAVALVSVLTSCGGNAPTEPAGEAPDDTGAIPLVDEARRVADQVEQRQADLEAQLDDPFSQP